MSLVSRLLGRRSKFHEPEFNSGLPVAGTPLVRPPTLTETIQSMIRREMSKAAVDEGYESFDEADDFEEEDPDTLPLTHHQIEALDRAELQEFATGYGLTLVDTLEADGAPQGQESAPQHANPAPAQASQGSPGADPV